jgi:hypothetical protein
MEHNVFLHPYEYSCMLMHCRRACCVRQAAASII